MTREASPSEIEAHKIETLADLLDVARHTKDRDGLFEDLRIWVELVLLTELPHGVKFKPRFFWKDDGDRGMSGVRLDIEKGKP